MLYTRINERAYFNLKNKHKHSVSIVSIWHIIKYNLTFEDGDILVTVVLKFTKGSQLPTTTIM